MSYMCSGQDVVTVTPLLDTVAYSRTFPLVTVPLVTCPWLPCTPLLGMVAYSGVLPLVTVSAVTMHAAAFYNVAPTSVVHAIYMLAYYPFPIFEMINAVHVRSRVLI